MPDVAIEDENERGRKRNILYTVDESPFFLLLPMFGLQQALLCISGIVTVQIVITQQLGVDDMPDVRSELLSLGFFTSGIGTILQNIVGSRLPVAQGSNANYLAPMAAILSLDKFSDKTLLASSANVTDPNELWKKKIREIQGNLMLAAGTHFLIGATGIMGFILKFIGPLTVAPTITVLGLYLGKLIMPLCGQHWGISFMSLSILVVVSLFFSQLKVPWPDFSKVRKCHVKRQPIFTLLPVVLAVGISWLVSHILTVTDVLPRNSTEYGHQARTDYRLKAVSDSSWFLFPLPFNYGTPTISAAGYVGMLAGCFASVIEASGAYFAAARVAEVAPPPPHAINRGLCFEGVATAVGGMIGAVCGATTYSGNIGAIAVTKVASRHVFVTVGVLMVIAGVVGKIGAIFTIIPDPVIGGVGAVVFAMITSVGVSYLQAVDLKTSRNLVIFGLSLMMGLRVPDVMMANPGALGTGSESFDQVVTVLLSTPMFVAGVLGCLLDNIVPGTKEERGIAKWHESFSMTKNRHMSSEKTYEYPYITKYIRKLKCCFYCPLSPTFNREITCNCRKKKGKELNGVVNKACVDENTRF